MKGEELSKWKQSTLNLTVLPLRGWSWSGVRLQKDYATLTNQGDRLPSKNTPLMVRNESRIGPLYTLGLHRWYLVFCHCRATVWLAGSLLYRLWGSSCGPILHPSVIPHLPILSWVLCFSAVSGVKGNLVLPSTLPAIPETKEKY